MLVIVFHGTEFAEHLCFSLVVSKLEQTVLLGSEAMVVSTVPKCVQLCHLRLRRASACWGDTTKTWLAVETVGATVGATWCNLGTVGATIDSLPDGTESKEHLGEEKRGYLIRSLEPTGLVNCTHNLAYN